MVANPYLPMSVAIQRVTDESDDRTIKSFDLSFVRPEDAACWAHRAGQFAEVSILGAGEAPFGVASSPLEVGFVRFTVKKAGLVTTRLHTLKAGDVIGLRGPLGNAFPLEAMAGQDVVVIGGGFAFTTLRALLVTLLHPSQRADYGALTVVYGARTPGLLMYKDDLATWAARDDLRLVQTIDVPAPGWGGAVGFVPAVVEQTAPDAANAVVVICGPPVMIRFTLPVLLKLGFPKERIYTSLENRMQCGLGQCGRCNVGKKYVCLDGPVFSMAELDELPPEY
ncbi:MAG: FAD/NAD(P)-binding protein [Chloroflexota bacterium]